MSMRPKSFAPGRRRFYWIASRLAVDFANTVVAADGSGDALRSRSDFSEFLAAAHVLLPATAPPAKFLARVLELRATIRRILAALVARRRLRPEWIAPVNEALRAAAGFSRLAPGKKGWVLESVNSKNQGELALAAIAASAAEIVTEGARGRVRKCGHPKCVLYFYDVSRAGRRRWCSMAVCGNRAKVAAYARRQR